MEMSFKIHGLDDAMKAMGKAFPDNPKQQRRLLNQAMSAAGRKSIIPVAKSLAMQGDGSGALSEAIAPRAVSLAKSLAMGKAAIVEITPVRGNLRAMAMYIDYYYTRLGKNAPANIAASGIRHGHLIEFGTAKTSARPFMWPAALAGRAAYISIFAKILQKKTEAAVRRAAKKRARARVKK